jgi:hypothetical protein
VVLFGNGIRAARLTEPATPADIAPTLAFLAGITLPQADGRVLREALREPDLTRISFVWGEPRHPTAQAVRGGGARQKGRHASPTGFAPHLVKSALRRLKTSF